MSIVWGTKYVVTTSINRMRILHMELSVSRTSQR